ncbi:IS3 family transposase [Candidatus Poriferisodalis sp.]|uniref:IS3 family transposase n=1 Tax=Candidatus Poriferisodalis sp. TaxID=3101277 RepID=UPI003D0EBED2
MPPLGRCTSPPSRTCSAGGCSASRSPTPTLGWRTPAESFVSTLEHELVTRRHYRTRDQAQADIAAWIDTWYNTKRLHSTNNMLSPIEYRVRTSQRNLTKPSTIRGA